MPGNAWPAPFSNAQLDQSKQIVTITDVLYRKIQTSLSSSPGHDNKFCLLLLQNVLQHGFHLLLALLFRHAWLANADKLDAKLLGNKLQVWMI